MAFKIIIQLTIIFALTQKVYAQEANTNCSDVLVSTKNMPQNNNQNEHNWCVFWSSADLLSFYEEEALSSYDLGLQYFNNDLVRDSSVEDYTDIQANMTAALILAQKGKGVCLESQTNFTHSDWGELSVMFKKLSDPKKSLIQSICENKYYNSMPFEKVPKNILKILDKLSADKKVAALLDVTCGRRHQFKNKYGVAKRNIENFPPEKLIEKLDLQLDQKAVNN
jgi:hypothetical protein